jgi:hypothetical protein
MDNMPNDYLIEIINPIDPKGQKVQAIIPHTLILNYYKYILSDLKIFAQ